MPASGWLPSSTTWRRVDLGDRVDRVVRHAVRACALGQALELHAGFDMIGEQRAILEEDQFGVVVAEGMLGLQVQLRLEAGLLSVERFFDLGQQVVAAEKELHRLLQFVDRAALRVLQYQVR